MLKFCCLLTGDDYSLLKNNTPKSRKKIYLFSTALLIPVISWAVLGFMIVHVIKGAGIPEGLVASLLCGTIIFALERIILISDGNWFLILMRIFLGIAIAIIGAAFIDQVLFKDEIDHEISIMKNEAKEEAFNDASHRLSIDINDQKAKTDIAEIRWLEAQNQMIGEADATTGTGVKGIGEVTELKAEVSNRMEVEFLKEQETLSQMKQTFFALREKTDADTEANFSIGALLIRFEALDRVVDKNKMAEKYYWMLTFILLIMEFMVVMVKYSCKKTSYDRLLEIQEYIGEKKANHFMSGKAFLTQLENIDPKLNSIRQKLRIKQPGMFN